MKKYDCNKTLDYTHELRRMCKAYDSCCDDNKFCPLKTFTCDSSMLMSQKNMDIVQKWSDEHPEPPKLTKRDRAFLECFYNTNGRKIYKDNTGNSVYYYYDDSASKLATDMFEALEPNTKMTFEELLKLEVEE